MGSVCTKTSKILKMGGTYKKLYLIKYMSWINEIRIPKCRRSLALDVYRISIHVQCNLRNCLQFGSFIYNIINLYKSIFLDFHFNILCRLYNVECDLHYGFEWMGNGSKWVNWSCSPYWSQCWLCCTFGIPFFVRLRWKANSIKLAWSVIIV